MTPEQWTLAERLYHEAASIAVADRDSWLARACAGDEIVRREVESLLAQDVSRTGALDGHALDLVTSEKAGESLVGRQLGGYEFCSLIDEGGMGQVYRARDLTLPRDVAIKVVSPSSPTTRSAGSGSARKPRSSPALRIRTSRMSTRSSRPRAGSC